MSLKDHSSSNYKERLRLEALEQELKRVRQSSLKQSTKISNLRLALYFQLAFFTLLFVFLFLKGFIDLPQNHTPAISTTKVVTDTIYIAKAPVKDSVYNITYNTHKAAMPKKSYDGVLFAIQIGAYKDLDLSEYKENLLGLKQDTYDSLNQFTLGEFIDYKEAQAFLRIIRGMGFRQAHIMSFKNGRRIQVKRAIQLQEEIKNTNTEADQDFLESNDDRFEILAQ